VSRLGCSHVVLLVLARCAASDSFFFFFVTLVEMYFRVHVYMDIIHSPSIVLAADCMYDGTPFEHLWHCSPSVVRRGPSPH
jgi:hypothetical protein